MHFAKYMPKIHILLFAIVMPSTINFIFLVHILLFAILMPSTVKERVVGYPTLSCLFKVSLPQR